ncbi:hypothetical protein IIA28_18600 [candidate division KSB1 bacterium]|nr:hypothetical protein [candidate division KSB1 bacterium]
MKKEAISLIVGTVWMFTLLGCSTTRVITPKTGFTLSEDAALVTTNGGRLGTRFVKTSGDSIVAHDYTFDRDLHFHFSDVQKVEMKDHGKGAWQGFLWGAAVGAVIGTVALKVDPVEDPLANARPFLWGIMGGIGGVLIGATKGKTETYLFEETQEQTNTSEKHSSTDAKRARTKRD